MSDQLRVDTDQLALRAAGVQDLGSKVDYALRALDAAMAAAGSCWGNDEIGKAFATNYVAPKDDVVKELRAVAKGLTTTGEQVGSCPLVLDT
ncbi:hypothetical protein [Micromonospora sp. NBC_01412]|uniref:hypothetical protein n=1 Tax=Micromonospora sp. NBC_01412 TaxID=2903590 RepID=UPI0032534B25